MCGWHQFLSVSTIGELYEHKLITEDQRNKMRNEIAFRCNRKRQQADRER